VNVLGSSMRASIDAQIDKQFNADYIVSPTGAGGIGTEVAGKVAATAGVSAATPFYMGQAKFDGKRQFYAAGDAAALARGTSMKLVSGGMDPGRDGMLVSEDLAESNKWTVGSAVPVLFPDGKTERLRVVGVYAKNDVVGPRVLAEETYLAHTARPKVQGVVVEAARPGAATKQAIERTLADYPNLKVQDRTGLKKEAARQVDQFVTFLTVLLVMSVIIAAVGVINTLALSVIERTREIGLLRAIGTSRRQLRRIIRLESIVIAVFGAVLGIAIGVVFGAALQRALEGEGLTVLSVPVATLAVYVVVAAVIGVLAAVWPAWRAGRMDVLKAIATE